MDLGANMIIPVLDLKKGKAVSGKSGKRDTYKPLKTIYCDSSDPEMIVASLKKKGFERIYLADLDAIEIKQYNWELMGRINKIIPVMLDYGVKDLEMAMKGLKFVDKIIVATETLESHGELVKILTSIPKDRLVISVDVKEGKVLSKTGLDCEELKTILDKNLPSELILLDISRVGTFQGINKSLLREFRELNTSIIMGGGIQGSDIKTSYDLGVDNILVGSALHNGKLNL
jgi:phosphoribosylformimino-5-aminoimidazole carboxamide ribotide isomerase